MEREDNTNKLLIQYFEKNITDEELIQLKEYLKESKENRKKFDEFNETYELLDITSKGWLYNVDSGWNQMKTRIQSEGVVPVLKMVSSKVFMVWKSAAVIAILLAATFMGLFIWDNLIPDTRMVKFIAPKGEKSKVILDDGTLVWLNSDSELSYNLNSNGNIRNVNLKGEGYFDVTKDKKHPFIVHTQNFDVKVYGTKFNVSAYNDDFMQETTLKEGSISILNKSTGKELLVKPGQQAIYSQKSHKIKLDKVRVDDYIAWTNNKLKFDNSSFSEMVKKIERWYDVKIIMDDKLLYKERYTLTIKTESLREVLELIKITTPINYEINEENVYITYDKR